MIRYVELLASALWELLVYDAVMRCRGFSGIHRRISRLRTGRRADGVEPEQVCEAVACAISLYWRRVHCLQRSAVAALLLRRYGWDARMVIGYRPVPFFSHAWVELDGVVVNDSPAYKRQLQVLEAI
jgi:hypothetical protein